MFVVVMATTLGDKRPRSKVYIDDKNMGHFGEPGWLRWLRWLREVVPPGQRGGDRPAPARGRDRVTGAGGPGGRVARRRACGTARRGHAAAVFPGPGRRPGNRQEHRRRRVRRARR